jgi:hypothetical protein
MNGYNRERRNRPAVVLLVALALATAGAAARAEEGGPAAAADDEDRFLTGLDFSYWADAGREMLGPGLTWGLVLKPGRLDLLLTVGAMMGDGIYTVPVELRFNVHFELTSWLDFYLAPGPMLLFDRFDGTWHHDLAIAVSAGLSVSPRGYDWALRVGGDYNLRVWRDVSNGGGFTVGFIYGF